MDQLVGVGAVPREAGDADRDRRPDRLARGLDVEARAPATARRMRSAISKRLLRRRLRQQDRELLAAEARRDVVVAQLRAEDLGDALQDGVAGEVAVGVVDVAQQVEVGHHQRERPVEALGARQLLVQREREVPCVEEAGLRVDARLLLQLRARSASGGSAAAARRRTGSATGSSRQKAAIATPSIASTSSVERLANEKSPDSRSEWPRARWSIGAISRWLTPTIEAAAARPAIA